MIQWKIPPRGFQEKHRSFKVDEKEQDAHTLPNHRYPLGSGNHPIRTGTPSLIPNSLLGWTSHFLPQTTHEQGLAPISLFFKEFRLTHSPSPWIGDYAWYLITYHRRNCKFRPLRPLKTVIRWRSRFPAPLPSDFSERYQIHSELVPSRYRAVMRSSTRKADSLLSCNKGTRGLVTHQTKPATSTFWIRPIPQILPTLSISSGNLASRLRASLHRSRSFLTFASKEVTVQLKTSYLSQDMAHSHLPHLSLGKLKSSRSMESAAKRAISKDTSRRPTFSTIAFTDSSLSLKPFTKQIPRKWLALDVAHQEIKPGAYECRILGPLSSFPLFLALSTPIDRHFLEGFLNTYQDGFLPMVGPRWTRMMPGTLIDGIFADAVTKGIAPDLHENMLTAMLQTAQKTRSLLNILVAMAVSYKTLGYLPDDFHEVWAIA